LLISSFELPCPTLLKALSKVNNLTTESRKAIKFYRISLRDFSFIPRNALGSCETPISKQITLKKQLFDFQ